MAVTSVYSYCILYERASQAILNRPIFRAYPCSCMLEQIWYSIYQEYHVILSMLPKTKNAMASFFSVQECAISSPTSYFWYREALNISPSIEEPGAPEWKIVLCLLLAWAIVFAGTFKGIKSSGKVWLRSIINLYFFISLPYFSRFRYLRSRFVQGQRVRWIYEWHTHFFDQTTPQFRIIRNFLTYRDIVQRCAVELETVVSMTHSTPRAQWVDYIDWNLRKGENSVTAWHDVVLVFYRR